MPPRPETEIIAAALANLVLGAVFLGGAGFDLVERLFGGLVAVGAVKSWCEYWQACDRHEPWRRRHGR